MKKAIRSGIRGALLTQGSATIAELSKKLGLSFPTVSKFLSQMEEEGELALAGMDDSSGGRRAKRYVYNPEYMLGLTVFLEKTETNYAVFNCLGEVKAQFHKASVLMEDLQSLAEHIAEIIEKYPRIRSLAVGVPASVHEGRITYIPGYERFDQADVKGYLEQRFSIPVAVENDMNAAVLGYYHRLDHKNNPSLVYLYFGQNGPGAGILVNGDVVRGSTFFSGEVSFIPQYDDRNFQQALYDGKKPEQAFLHEEGMDAVSRLVASFGAILNPNRIVFNRDEVNQAILDRIADRSAVYFPAQHLPELIVSDWKLDYIQGLQHLGLNLMITEPGI
ncbi:ROK family transcriptional regulator [Paenibacillus sp. DMB20]|uniref:ROK family transcriptional regulator n=1 Tax=Paenibacillus sp. DMB20 TaxID=1642570 RepID=UPI00062826CD|nr:ROK family transcriptional regulator [Paenibacillus sp. DMB20]KKO53891.1 ROK family transcriptional regulator [Paenibacillus sp. DMB20]